jgi:Uma2 family endonuclease
MAAFIKKESTMAETALTPQPTTRTVSVLLQDICQGEMEHEPIPAPPTQDELPYEDDENMESERHRLQMNLLIESLRLHWSDRQDFFAGGNMFVYFSLEQTQGKTFRGPDFFVALGVEKGRERKSWVVWEEGKAPDVVIELLSPSTAVTDRTEKKELYQSTLRVPEYYWFDPISGELAGFVLRGRSYEPISPDNHNRLVSEALQLALTVEEGTYQDHGGRWLRWQTPDGQTLLAGEEHAEHEHNRAEREHERAERLAARLRELGIDPDVLP